MEVHTRNTFLIYNFNIENISQKVENKSSSKTCRDMKVHIYNKLFKIMIKIILVIIKTNDTFNTNKYLIFL